MTPTVPCLCGGVPGLRRRRGRAAGSRGGAPGLRGGTPGLRGERGQVLWTLSCGEHGMWLWGDPPDLTRTWLIDPSSQTWQLSSGSSFVIFKPSMIYTPSSVRQSRPVHLSSFEVSAMTRWAQHMHSLTPPCPHSFSKPDLVFRAGAPSPPASVPPYES